MSRTDFFEWDDATQKIVQKAVKERDLDNSSQNLVDNAESSINKNFNQFNFDSVLRERDTVVKSIQQNLGPRLDTLEQKHQRIVDRMDSDEFQADRQDNAIDWSDFKDLKDAYDLLREVHSQTTIWAFVAHANSQDIAEAVEIHQMQADQNEAMRMVNEHYDKFEGVADRIGRQIKDGFQDALEEFQQVNQEEFEEKQEELKDVKAELKDLKENTVTVDEVEPLTSRQKDLVDLVHNNPEKGMDWYANQMSIENRIVSKLESDIQKKGYRFSVDR
jgi:hypothetical protein